MKNPVRALRNLPVTPGAAASPSGSLRERIEHAAIEKGVLDKLDSALMATLARRAGRAEGVEDIALHAVSACLLAATRSGGLRIPLDPAAQSVRLEAFLRSLFPAPAGTPAESAEDMALSDLTALAENLSLEFARNRLAGAYQAILGEPPEFKPLLHAHGGLYFQKHLGAESAVSARLAALLSAADSGLDAESQGGILDTVLDRFPLRLSSGSAMSFDPKQKEALALALRKRFTVISGGPGTGKTSLAANLLRAWTRAHSQRTEPGAALPRIRLAAPTGRAAQRLAESLRRSLDSVSYGVDGSGPAADAVAGELRIDRFVSELPCETLHALLRYNPGSGEYFHQNHRPLPADLVVVDEVSMVDIFALARLLEALEEHACLVLLGDMDQLPSVEAGSVLADLIPAGEGAHPLRDNLVLLDRSHRSEAGILDVTRRINAMDGSGALAAFASPLVLHPDGGAPWPILFLEAGRDEGGGCRMLLPSGGAAASASGYRKGWDDWMESWVDFHYLDHSLDGNRFPGRILATPRRASYQDLVAGLCRFRPPRPEMFHAGLARSRRTAPATDPASAHAPDAGFAAWLADLDELFAYLDQARILTLTRKGWHGAESINRRIRDRLARRWDPHAPSESGDGFNGSPILILENDHGKGLFNGDVGVMLRLAGGSLAFFRRAEGYLAFPAPFLPRHEPAFAMTVHKSQGSEYDQALIVLPESGNRLLFKETLYTALTRARHFAGLYGPAEAILEAVGRKAVRESGLAASLATLLRS